MATLFQDEGDFAQARRFYQAALRMCQSLYPESQYPRGHPQLAGILLNLGTLLEAQGTHGEARGYYERALEMREAFYPEDRYPQGHPDLADSLNTLGWLLRGPGCLRRGAGVSPAGAGDARGPVPQRPRTRWDIPTWPRA